MRTGTIGTIGLGWGINSDSVALTDFTKFSDCFVSVFSWPLLILNMFTVNKCY